jgi:hypothetical protein
MQFHLSGKSGVLMQKVASCANEVAEASADTCKEKSNSHNLNKRTAQDKN